MAERSPRQAKRKRKSSWSRAYGPVALITGASEGIGRAFARECAKRGLDVVLVARRGEALRALANELQESYDVSALPVPLDLGVTEHVERLLETIKHMEIGLFVPAAGFGTSGNFIDTPLADELNMIDVNCRAVVQLVQPIARQMAARRRGGIVLMSSIVAFQGVPRSANYAATKAFIQTFAEGLRSELKRDRVRVLACAPGPIASGFASRARMTMGLSQPAGAIVAETLDALGHVTTVRPGWVSKLLGYALALLPRFARVLLMKQIMADMTRPAKEADGTQQ